MPRKLLIAIMVVCLGLVALLVVYDSSNTTGAPPTKSTYRDTARLEEMRSKLEEANLLKRLDIDGHDAWVDPLVWSVVCDAKDKENVALFLSEYCGKPQYIDIYDNQSGKKLAHFGFSGFKVY